MTSCLKTFSALCARQQRSKLYYAESPSEAVGCSPTQPDPIGIAGGLNVYGYAGGDPINNQDPFGLCDPFPECATGLGGLKESLEQVAEAVKSIPGQVVDFATDPAKGGFVAGLASIPAAAATAGVFVGARVSGAVTRAAGGALVRAQVTALNNPVGTFLTGVGLGASGIPVPQGFGRAMKLGEAVGKILDKVTSLAQ